MSQKTFCFYQSQNQITKSPQEMNNIANQTTYKYDRKTKRMVKICECPEPQPNLVTSTSSINKNVAL